MACWKFEAHTNIQLQTLNYELSININPLSHIEP